jgi:TolA-binding protein
MLARPAATERGAAPGSGAALDEMSRPTTDEPRAVAIGNRSADAVAREEAPPVRAARQSGGASNWGAAAPPPQIPSSPPARDRDRDKSLKSELGYLEEARTALEAHVGASAMRLLDEYTQQFPAGSMRIEAISLRVEALLVLGRRSDAQALGNDFLARYPSSPAAMRVRLLLGPRDNTPSKP